MNGFERIVLAQFAVSAKWTAFSVCTVVHRGLPFMPVRTFPPYLPFRAFCQLIGRHRFILSRVPFLSDLRKKLFQIVVRTRFFAAAVRTSGSVQRP